jgi:RNA polymerase sigma-70 factor (ECF subfamily)
LVLRARGETPEARAALSELCGAYWKPVQRHLRNHGHAEEAARELTQEFFAGVLAGGSLAAADPARGRFRSYLLGAVKHFLSDRRERDARLKRAGDRPHEPYVPGDEEPARTVPPPDAAFDREWALALMGRALDTVEAEHRAAGRAEHFQTLRPWLTGGDAADSTDAARRLGLGANAFKVAVHRIRRRFREAIRAEVRQTLPAEADPEEELRYLVEVLSRG